MLRGQDVVVLLWLAGRPGVPPTLGELGSALDLSPATVQRALLRLDEAGLINRDRKVMVAQADELLAHGIRYMFPAQMGGEARGVATAWGAPPLADLLAGSESPPLVWPHPQGRTRGIALSPIHEAVPDLAQRNQELYERLALVDALRVGDPRVRGLARGELRRRLAPVTSPAQ